MSNNQNPNQDETKLLVEESEKHLLLDHNYDGIHEFDNPLPSWWQFTFYGGLVFAVLYFLFYVVLGGPSLHDEFKEDYARIETIKALDKKNNKEFDMVVYQEYLKHDGVKRGEVIFNTNCVACHKEKGVGDIGPNLTDEYWLWAKGTPETIFPVVYNGVLQNGMPVWSEVLSKEEIYLAVAYVMSLHNTHVPGGKAPQGTKYVETPNGPVAEGAPVNPTPPPK